MARIEETPLPGVGLRYAFETGGAERLSVVHHHSGRVQVYVAEPDDPDAARLVLDLDDADSRVLAELLGASQVVREIDRLQQSVSGLSIEWLEVPDGSEVCRPQHRGPRDPVDDRGHRRRGPAGRADAGGAGPGLRPAGG